MTIPMSASDVLDREFLEMRAKCLELAASFDRLDRANGAVNDARMDQLRKALEIVNQPKSGRAAEIQRLFSLAYDPDWQQTFAQSGSSSQTGTAAS